VNKTYPVSALAELEMVIVAAAKNVGKESMDHSIDRRELLSIALGVVS